MPNDFYVHIHSKLIFYVYTPAISVYISKCNSRIDMAESKFQLNPHTLNHPPSPLISIHRFQGPTPCYITSSFVPSGDYRPKTSTLMMNSPAVIYAAKVQAAGTLVELTFGDGVYMFRSQWLYDAEVDNSPVKNANEVFIRTQEGNRAWSAEPCVDDLGASLYVQWDDGKSAKFPAIWLRSYVNAMAGTLGGLQSDHQPRGWLAPELVIPEIQCRDIVAQAGTPSQAALSKIYSMLLPEDSPGIIKIVGLPQPNVEGERRGDNAIVTHILKKLFGSVSTHLRRQPDTTFNIASNHAEDSKKGETLLNYDTPQLLQSHTDMSHYQSPSRIQGLYMLEGHSIDTFVSCQAVMDTFRKEEPGLIKHLYDTPTAIGKVAPWYEPHLYQETIETPAMMGSRTSADRLRWHPHPHPHHHHSASIVAPFEAYNDARARQAFCTFQEIGRRATHLLQIALGPGDLYVWDNHRIVHGRDRILSAAPRTSVGAVPEQVVAEAYRAHQIGRLRHLMDEKWLIHVPQAQLDDMVALAETAEDLRQAAAAAADETKTGVAMNETLLDFGNLPSALDTHTYFTSF